MPRFSVASLLRINSNVSRNQSGIHSFDPMSSNSVNRPQYPYSILQVVAKFTHSRIEIIILPQKVAAL